MGYVREIRDAYNWNLTSISAGFGVDRGTARRKLRQAHIQPVKVLDGVPLYALSEAIPALYRADPVAQKAPDEMNPLDRRAWFQSENARLAVEDRMRHLVEAADAAEQFSILKRAIQNGLRQLPAMLADCLDDTAMELVRARLAALDEQLATLEPDHAR